MAKQSMVSFSSQDDLFNWEFINRSDIGLESDDDDSIYEVNSSDLAESIGSLTSTSDDDDGVNDEKEGLTHDVEDDDDDSDDDVKNPWVLRDLGQNLGFHNADLSNFTDNHHKNDGILDCNYGMSSYPLWHNYDAGHQYANDDNDDEEEEEEEEDDESDDGNDIDDELVPWEVKDRFMRQRIRKSGKISFGRAARSKKSALVFTRPGCVRGKHGLGLKVY